MFNVNQQKFSLSVAGESVLIPRFVELLKQRFPRITIYNRNEEASRPPSNHPIPSHPEVADIDVTFSRQGSKETATIRNLHLHRFYNYFIESAEDRQPSHDLILKQMVEEVEEMISSG
jgi:hypothetical protein